MYYRSFVQDDPACASSVSVENGVPVFTGAVAGSAASTCPDAYAWTQLAQTITSEFWNWGLDQTVWPANPLPLCTGSNGPNCCDPNAGINPSGPMPTQCPVFRADYDDPGPLPAQPAGTPSGETINHAGLRLADDIDPGRLLRDLELELVFRNAPMVDYIYRNDLYTKEGLGARNRAQNAALLVGDVAGAHALEVRFSVDATMVKADFLHQDILLDQGLIQTTDNEGNALNPPNNPDYPYITVNIQNPAEGSVNGYYYLIAMTNANKALPVWHWYAIEHVANLGRCDYIGCNDSFGYAAAEDTGTGARFGTSYIAPMTILNNDQAIPPGGSDPNSPLFVTGGIYSPDQPTDLTASPPVMMTGETMTRPLQALFRQMGIGTGSRDPDNFTAGDPAWLSYRLKGTQTGFVTSSGVPTGTGATVTEGGFVNSASCATCHSQASVDANGNAGMQGVGSSWTPNLMGYDRVEMGAPNMAWFYSNGGPSVNATQIDFIWGILAAQCARYASGNSGPCAHYPSQPTIVPAARD